MNLKYSPQKAQESSTGGSNGVASATIGSKEQPNPSVDTIESPMHMNYREAYAWQLGWDKGFKAGKESVTQHKLADSCKEVSDNTLLR